MKRFGAILSVYLGIYLILPGCLCQILFAFGLGESPGRPESSHAVIASLASDTPCHCHEASGKLADLVPAGGVQEAPFVAVSELPPAFSATPPLPPAVGFSPGRSPPPRPCLTANRLRSVTGVFLI